jgi:hypothetical protein
MPHAGRQLWADRPLGGDHRANAAGASPSTEETSTSTISRLGLGGDRVSGRSSGSEVASSIAERHSTLIGRTLTSTTETTIWWKHRTERAERGEFGDYILGSQLASIATYMIRGELATRPDPVAQQHAGEAILPRCCLRQAPRSCLKNEADSEIAYAHYLGQDLKPSNCPGSPVAALM